MKGHGEITMHDRVQIHNDNVCEIRKRNKLIIWGQHNILMTTQAMTT
jgi:hypothetical protein